MLLTLLIQTTQEIKFYDFEKLFLRYILMFWYELMDCKSLIVNPEYKKCLIPNYGPNTAGGQ
jgi:hypothetical protein